MTGITGNLLLALKVILVNVHHHAHHRPGRFLGLLRVCRAIRIFMAEFAVHAKRAANQMHGLDDLVGGSSVEDFDVLIKLFGRLPFHGRRGGLCPHEQRGS